MAEEPACVAATEPVVGLLAVLIVCDDRGVGLLPHCVRCNDGRGVFHSLAELGHSVGLQVAGVILQRVYRVKSFLCDGIQLLSI